MRPVWQGGSRMFRNVLLVVASAAAILGCTAMRIQKSWEPKSVVPAPAQTSLYKNLQVLPPDITREQLKATMRGYARSLGVHCDHCHVAVGDDFDFPSDAKREKMMGRLMIRMARTINQDYLVKVTENPATISCWTCHRGHETPEPEPPAPPPGTGNAPRPGLAPPSAAPAPPAPAPVPPPPTPPAP
jgi:hypothetical protein